MASPTGSVTITPNPAAPGATLTATVNFADADNRTGTASFTLTDQAGNTTTTTGSFVVADTVTAAPAAGNDRVWTLVPGSVTSTQAKFSATA